LATIKADYLISQCFVRSVSRIPADRVGGRYSDEQLYALALWVYSLQPPPNPNKFDALAERGQKIIERESCVMCYTPPLYTNNKLTPAEGPYIASEYHFGEEVSC
jgi:hypothetical protein